MRKTNPDEHQYSLSSPVARANCLTLFRLISPCSEQGIESLTSKCPTLFFSRCATDRAATQYPPASSSFLKGRYYIADCGCIRHLRLSPSTELSFGIYLSTYGIILHSNPSLRCRVFSILCEIGWSNYSCHLGVLPGVRSFQLPAAALYTEQASIQSLRSFLSPCSCHSQS